MALKRLFLFPLVLVAMGLATASARADLTYLGEFGSGPAVSSDYGKFNQGVFGVGVANGHVNVLDWNTKIEQFTTAGSTDHVHVLFGSPDDIVTGSDGTTYALSWSTSSRVYAFNDSLTQTGTWNLPTAGTEGYRGIGLDETNHRVLVADTDRNRVLVYNTAGALQRTITRPSDSRFKTPYDVAADSAGNIYVLTQGYHAVWEFKPDGTFIRMFGVDGLDTWSIAVDGSDNVYVVDRALGAGLHAGVVRVYTAYGGLVTQFGGGHLTQPQGIAVDTDGTVYVGSTWHVTKWGGSLPPLPPPSCSTRQGRTIGNVAVCADLVSATSTPGVDIATGDVTLNGGVSVGNGPITLNSGTKDISSGGASVTVRVLRSPAVEIASGRLDVRGTAVTDPVSGRTNLASLTISGPFEPLVGGVPFLNSMVSSYLDHRDGGGVIFTMTPGFDLLKAAAGAAPVGTLAVGVHHSASSRIRVLGGSFGWNGVKLVDGWKIGKLALSYASATDSWSLTGGAELPFLQGVGLEVTGSTRGRKVDKIDVTVKLGANAAIPLGTTGIFVDTFGGFISGLAGQDPIMVQARTGGGWTKTGAPRPFNWILHIKNVSITIDTSGAGTIAGEVDILDGEGRLAKGAASFTIRISPTFSASGTLDVDINALLMRLTLAGRAAMNSAHFTATGDATGKLFGLPIGRARAVISDTGFGGTGSVCFLGHCTTVGYGIYWRDVTSFPPNIQSIGADVDRFVTIRTSAGTGVSAAAKPIKIHVEPGRPFLLVQGHGASAGSFTLISPRGRRYTVGRHYRDAATQRGANGRAGAIVIYAPVAGNWRLLAARAGARFEAQQIRGVGKITSATISPRTSRNHRLTSRTRKIRIAWRSKGLPRTTRLVLYLSTRRGVTGTAIKGRLRPTGSYTLATKRLRKGANYLTLVAIDHGIPYEVRALPAVWKR